MMRGMVTRLFIVLSFSGLCFATAPASQPAIETATVEQLIRQLNAPLSINRQQAADQLHRLGPAIIPMLERAGEVAPLETRSQIDKIIADLRVRGVLVLYTFGDDPAFLMKIEPGDIITKINDISIESYEDFNKKSPPLEKSTRTLTVRTGARFRPASMAPRLPAERRLDAPPGNLGMYVGDYEGRYGEPLSMAMQQLVRAECEPVWWDARKNFERAMAAGLVFDDDSMLEPTYAAICYYCGDAAKAYEHFEAYARRRTPQPWRYLANKMHCLLPTRGHLHLYFLRQQLRSYPRDVQTNAEIAMAYSWRLNRYLEGTSTAISALKNDGQRFDDLSRSYALHALQNAFAAMGLMPEASEALGQLASTDANRELWPRAFHTAAEAGEYKLAVTFGSEVRDGIRRRELDLSFPGDVLGLCIGKGLLDDAGRMLDSYDDPSLMDTLLWELRNFDLGWPQSQTMLAGFARRCLSSEEGDEGRPIAAFRILSRLAKPDLKELEGLVSTLSKAPIHWSRNGETTDWNRYLPAMLAMLKEDYPEALQLVAKTNDRGRLPMGGPDDVLPASFRKAAEFLHRYGVNLTGEQSVWKRTFRAFERPAGGFYLLTRDQHIGWSDGKTCREIPLPEPVWSFSDVNWAFLVSSSGKTVLTTGLNRVYKLRTDESGWDLLCSMPRRVGKFYLTELEPVLDELVSVIQESGVKRDLAWPLRRFEFRSDKQPEFFMLSDGTWIGFDPRTKRLQRVPREKLAELARDPVEIYAIHSSQSMGSHNWVFTNRGLFDWQPQSDQVKRAVLPGIDGRVRVLDVTELVPTDEAIRVALFPEDGGTTFLLDESTGKITLEGLVNEAYPETYWRQQPTEVKRKQFREAIAKAGLTWPLSAVSTQPSK